MAVDTRMLFMKDLDDDNKKNLEEQTKVGHCQHEILNNNQKDVECLVPGYDEKIVGGDLVCECVRCSVIHIFFLSFSCNFLTSSQRLNILIDTFICWKTVIIQFVSFVYTQA
jgi:hypothetical protein